MFIEIYVLTTFVSVIITLAVEVPISKIIKLLSEPNKVQQNTETEVKKDM